MPFQLQSGDGVRGGRGNWDWPSDRREAALGQDEAAGSDE